MLDSASSNGIGGSQALVKPTAAEEEEGGEQRGWDWRKGLAGSATGDEVLRILRLGLAKDMARLWIHEGSWE